MERLPRRTPAAQMDIVGLVFDALATMVEDIPIIGDIVGFVASLFGNSSASNARIARLETIVSKGSSGYDDFNRADTGSSLGRGPQMTADWVQGGNGENLRIAGRAARLVEGSLAPSQGRRWARYPTPASSSTMTADTICDDKNIDTSACTTLIVCANEAFTEGIYANVFGTGVYLGKFTRTGTTWSFNDFSGGTNPTYKIGTAERIELRASGSGLYQLVVENSVVASAEDTSFPIDAAHRYCGFAIQMNIPTPFNYQYGWGLSAFSMKSEAGTFTAIEAVETVANGAVTVANGAATVANGAQTAAENAVDTAITEATAAATAAATTAAEAAAAAIGAAQAAVVESAQAAIISIQAGMPVQPYSHSPLNHECTFDWAELAGVSDVDLTGSVGNDTGSWSQHRHTNGTSQTANTTLDRHDHPDTFDVDLVRAPKYVPPANTIEWGLVRSKWTGQRGAVSYAVDTLATNANPLYIYIASMSAETGKVTVQHISADQASVISSSGGQLYNMPDEVRALFASGDSMWLGIGQPGSQQRRAIYCKTLPAFSFPGAIFPSRARASSAATGPVAEGTVIETSSFDFSATQQPYIGIGQPANLPLPEPNKYFEGFDNGIPSSITRRSGGATVTDGVFVQSSTTDGASTYQVNEKMTRSDMEVSGQVRNPTSRYQYLGVRDGGSNYSSRVEVAVNSTTVRIEQNGFFAAGVLASQSMSVSDGDVFKIRADLNVYTVFKLTGTDTWTPVPGLTYTDSSNSLPRSADNRNCTLATSRNSFNNSGGWGYVLCQSKPDEGWPS